METVLSQCELGEYNVLYNQSSHSHPLDMRRPFPAIKQFVPRVTSSRFLQSTHYILFLFPLDTSSTSPPSIASSSKTSFVRLFMRFSFNRSRLRHPCSGNTSSESPVTSTSESLFQLQLFNTKVWRSFAAPSSKSSSSIVQSYHQFYSHSYYRIQE